MEAIYKRLKPHTVLIAEDDLTARRWLERVLGLYFKEVRSAPDATGALALFDAAPSDIVIADIRMPDFDGLHMMQKITVRAPQTLRIIVTAYNSAPYLNGAVEAGAHFYLKKPIDLDEMLVAIASHFAPVEDARQATALGKGFEYRHLEGVVYRGDALVRLTKKELRLLELLLRHRRGIVSLEMIEREVWDEPATPDAIRMVIVGLRRKLPAALIENLKGVGYRLELPQPY